ncbi:MAG: hypothetical protein ACXWQQ_04445 [Pseudobdellovibrio sp.]
MNKIWVSLIFLVSANVFAGEELTSEKVLNLCRAEGIQEACDYKDIQTDLADAEIRCGLVGKLTNSSDCKEVDKLKKQKDEALKKLIEVMGV